MKFSTKLNSNINNIDNENQNKSLINNPEKSLNKMKKSKENSHNDFILKKVKSKYIIKKIFQNIEEKKKLLLTKYNKFQSLLGIDIELYKKISGKIKIGETNGFGKEYNLDSMNLIFKGYYINGKRHGKGEEYKDNKLIFEGEYKNGKRNGKGIEYEDYGGYEGYIIYEGEFRGGKKWNGKIKEYFEDFNKEYSHLKFFGEYINGKKKGKEYYKDGNLLFEGEYLEDKRWNGILYSYLTDETYQIKDGNGIVIEYDNECGELIFDGEYLNGEKWNGELKEYERSDYLKLIEPAYYSDPELFYYCEKKINEKVKNNKDILKFEGEYFNGNIIGKVNHYDIDGKLIFQGIYFNDENEYEKKFDKKRYYLKFEGIIKNGFKNGKAKEYNSNGELIFEGEYSNGVKNGKAKEYDQINLYFYSNILKFEGEYLNGKKKGKEYNSEGKLVFEGEYLNNERWNGKGIEFNKYGNSIFEGEYLNGKNGTVQFMKRIRKILNYYIM